MVKSHVEALDLPATVTAVLTRPYVKRWTPSFGQVFVTAKVESGS